MNEDEVNRQIQQMVHSIRQDAEEKANEIFVATEEVIIPIVNFTTMFVEFWVFYIVTISTPNNVCNN